MKPMVEEQGDDTTASRPHHREPASKRSGHPGRGMQAPGAQPFVVREVLDLWFPVVSLRSITGCTLRNPRFRIGQGSEKDP